jgi:hypothetical protein
MATHNLWYPKADPKVKFKGKEIPPMEIMKPDPKSKIGRPYKPINQCPRCVGLGVVHDLKTGIKRCCVCCGGSGTIPIKHP